MRLLGLLMIAVGLVIPQAATAEENLFAIEGKLFVFNYRIAEASYLVRLKPVKQPVDEGQVAVALFEDPAGGSAIEVKQKIWPKLGKVTIDSPPIRCVQKDKPYRVSIAITGADGTVKQTIRTNMVSDVDQSVLPDKPLVVGPVYTPNPELAGRPSGKMDVTNEQGCPGR